MSSSIWLAAATALAASSTVSPGDDLTAAAASLQPGDTITFGAGTYELEGTVYWTAVGTPEEPVELLAAPGAEVILRGIGGGYIASLENSDNVVIRDIIFEAGEDSEYNGTSGLSIYESTNVTLEDCVIRDVWGTALWVNGNTNNITIRRNEIHGTGDGSGIYVGCGDASCWMQDSVIENNLVHDVQGTGINLQAGTQNVSILNNVVFRTRDEGLVLPDTQFGAQNIAQGNAIWQTEDAGIFIWGPALLQNNVVFETGGDGIYTYDQDGSLYDVQISHNTVARTDGYAANLDDWFEAEGMVFANNALSNPVGYGLDWYDPSTDPYSYEYGTTTTNFIRNNVVTGLVQGFDLLVRPDFVIPGGGPGDYVDIDNFDFYPTPTSQLRDAATPDGNAYIPPLDFNGTPRDGTSPDVGAYEYDGEGNPGWVIQEGFKEVGLLAGRGGADFKSGCCGANKGNGEQALIFLPLLGVGVLARRRRR